MNNLKNAKIATKKNQAKKIPYSSDWNLDVLHLYETAISNIANDFKLDTYKNQIEIITSEQMMDAYSYLGMPIGYNHWSFGKKFLDIEKSYKLGAMGLAYELVINSDPCIAYLMEENTLPIQALVIAHACYGHNSFFKGNYLFKSWTDASTIIDYLLFAKNFILQCEERYGVSKVEDLLDSCHALMNYGVDKYRRPQKLSLEEEKLRQVKREEYLQSQINELWRTIPSKQDSSVLRAEERFPLEPEENILFFIEKNAPLLEPWEREVVRIVRKIAQYFYPQRQTKVMNEGWATFWHYTIMQTMYDRALIDDKFMLEILHNHTNILSQLPYDSPYFSGINPYTLGFSIFQDIKRICDTPTDEDKAWFKDFAGANWLEVLDFAMRNFKDESFIAQFLSPKVMRDLKLFALLDDDNFNELEVQYIHNDSGYQMIRELLAKQYNLSCNEPNIQVYNVDKRGDRTLTLRHIEQDNRPLSKQHTLEVLKHLHRLWGFKVRLETVNESGNVFLEAECPRVKT